MNVRVKICGITTPEDAVAAAEAGADAIGLMFYAGSPRRVDRVTAAAISAALPPFVARVGVFVNPTEGEVREAIRQCDLDVLQFHGEETPEFCRRFGRRVIKAFRIQNAASLNGLPAYAQETWLLDSFVPGQRGGTGATFNWDLAARAVKAGGRVILAGGLTADNVADAIRAVQPYGVDVSSGVESAPGRKDRGRMVAFVRAVREG
ncbi:MAG TPA: phosphoribosylanthranilate isomerase [Methylomirabilota bacterium]|nr:phosphoribosylanthranilate isomerase [Methylomirabilota bacterium]